jgi:hypothetical protein
VNHFMNHLATTRQKTLHSRVQGFESPYRTVLVGSYHEFVVPVHVGSYRLGTRGDQELYSE